MVVFLFDLYGSAPTSFLPRATRGRMKEGVERLERLEFLERDVEDIDDVEIRKFLSTELQPRLLLCAHTRKTVHRGVQVAGKIVGCLGAHAKSRACEFFDGQQSGKRRFL
jgi:hypothetical protein